MKKLIQLIENRDFHSILAWAVRLNEVERKEALSQLKEISVTDILNVPEKKRDQVYYDQVSLLWNIQIFMQVCCLRSFKDLSLTAPDWNKTESALHAYLRNPLFGVDPLVEYFRLYPPDYLDKVIQQVSKDRQANVDFRLLWQLYKEGWVSYDEEIFIRSLFIIPMFRRKTERDIEFLTANPETIERVLLQFYKYEIPVLDISKWESADGGKCAKCTEYWDEVFAGLMDKGLFGSRDLITKLLETLTLNWKKGHLDWHIRLIRMLQPADTELLANQSLFIACLFSTNNTVINFAVESIGKIYRKENFDRRLFIESVVSLYSREKCDKSILAVLEMIEWLVEKEPGLQNSVNEMTIAFIQPNEKVQLRVAELLVKYIDPAELSLLIEPYITQLKEKPRKILSVEKTIRKEDTTFIPMQYQPLAAPASWEELLFHIGKTLEGLHPADIDLLYEGMIQLQDEFPADFKEQLKPYTKRLFKAGLEKEPLFYLSEFFDNWLNKPKKYTLHPQLTKKEPNPFLRKKNQWVLKKLHSGSKLPLLSTPTHSPFYIDPDILEERIQTYKKAGETVENEDLAIARNRIIPGLGNAQQTNQPFLISYEVKRTHYEKYHWDRLLLENNWGQSYEGKKLKSSDKSPAWYEKAFGHYDFYSWKGFDYLLSMYPQCTSPLLLHFIPDTASGNEVAELEYCLYPLQFLIENQLRVQQGGWIYIALCLLFEKKVSRELAAEYITMAMEWGTLEKDYLATCIGYMIACHFAPVNRLIEYFDRPENQRVKEFQYLVTSCCINEMEIDNLPVNSKKIFQYHTEFAGLLSYPEDKRITEKIKQLMTKKKK